MSTYVLIHGAWHGGWCWHKVVPLLERAGHRALAPDLPGHGNDRTPPAAVTLQAYADRVCEVLSAQPEPVILVGHSMGGAVISQAAEQCPDRVKTLVYLCAYLLRDGEVLSTEAQKDPERIVGRYTVPSADGTSMTVRDEGLKALFYTDCSDEDVAYARERLVPQAIAPLATPVHVSAERWGRIPRVYIECLHDRTISPTAQKRMYSAMPGTPVLSLHTGHSPFFSAPQALADHLLSLA